MARQERKWHPKFNKYMAFIVKHPNYAGMPSPYKKDGSIRWVVTGKSAIGARREAWWDKKRKPLDLQKKAGWKAKVARAIHPTGKKPCQICGKLLKLDYVYPNKSCPYCKSPLEECDKVTCEYYIKKGHCSHLGPGAMSNCPDRFDGFHTYNRCCRSKEDTGRRKENLRRYGEDRRVYEFWADGDWKKADWLMQEFRRHKISPDHIGPISLGFCHRPKFMPMTTSQNIAKGNRLTFNDVQELLKDEKQGASVVSKHSKSVWDLLKNLPHNDEDAKLVSALMRLNLHRILIIFSIIAKEGYQDFLIENFLHPEYALYQHEFKDFDPKTGKVKIATKRANRTEHRRNAARYIRKSFEALKKYRTKQNRKVKFITSAKMRVLLDSVLKALSLGNKERANLQLERIFQLWTHEAVREFVAHRKPA